MLTNEQTEAIEEAGENVDDEYAAAYHAKLLDARDPGPSSIKYDGAETRIAGDFGEVTISGRDGEPGTLVMVDSSAASNGQPLVVMLNDDVHEIAPEPPASAGAVR